MFTSHFYVKQQLILESSLEGKIYYIRNEFASVSSLFVYEERSIIKNVTRLQANPVMLQHNLTTSL